MALLLLLLMASFFAPLSCGLAGSGACRCVPSSLCGDDDADGDEDNGQGLLDIRSSNKICQGYLEVCCENPIIDPSPLNEPPIYKGCGFQRPFEVISRITSDSKTAGFAELPWTAVVLLRDAKTDRNMYKCGGSLIHPQVILTAAHCVSEVDSNFLRVRAGERNTKSQEEPHQDRSVVENQIHPKFHPTSLKNDVALLFLNEPFIPTHSISVICVPPPHLQVEESSCTVGGWGKNAFKKAKYSPILKKVDIPLVPREKCLSALRKTRLGGSFILHKSFICAGGEANRDTCKGDGGSPLTCPIPGKEVRFFQMGIVSWGIGCGEKGVPGVYVNVPFFSRWIDDELHKRGMNTSVYKY